MVRRVYEQRYVIELAILINVYMQLLEPHPGVVASKLLARKNFKDTGN